MRQHAEEEGEMDEEEKQEEEEEESRTQDVPDNESNLGTADDAKGLEQASVSSERDRD